MGAAPNTPMLAALKRLFARDTTPVTWVNAAVGTELVRHASLPEDLAAEDAAVPPIQVDGDPAPGRAAVDTPLAKSPRDVFVAAGGLGLPALALVNLRDPQARVELWALDSPTPGPASRFAARRPLRWPAGRESTGWQAIHLSALPRLQCLVALRHDDAPRTAMLAVLDLATGAMRELDVVEPDPFEHAPSHVAALRAAPDAVLVRWHRGRVALGSWGDVAAEDVVLLFTPRERAGLPLLRLSLDDGNIHAWGMRGTTLWMKTIDGRPRPAPRVFVRSLDIGRIV